MGDTLSKGLHKKPNWAVERKRIRLSQEFLVETTFLDSSARLPLVLKPAVSGICLATWAESNRDYIEALLLKYGALLFRGFDTHSITDFERVAKAISPELIEYGERSSPRSKLSEGIYTSTDHPADQYILLHNEQSYTLNWPMKIWFCCLLPSQSGGRTPIADSRKIFERLDPQIIERFAEKGVMYLRNYGDGLALSWREVFQTNDRSIVEEHCRNADIEFEWKDSNRLRTRQVRPAIRKHPKTQETVWFNHALFFNVLGLDSAARESMLAVVDEDDVPFNTFYGDGSPIDHYVLDEIRMAYRQETVSFEWQQSDILILDNMLMAHGRDPYEGPRKVVVAMAEPYAAQLASNK
jgi:alpha-ketoglutarate-dependent taurine dioxygenase